MTEIHQTACPLDCPDSCSLEVEVENGRVTKLEGTTANPLTQGFLCSKVRRFGLHLYGADRLLSPAVRTGKKGDGEFRDIPWSAAFDLIVSRFTEARERFGGEAILPLSYGGSNGVLTQDTTDARLFYRLGASRLARTVCAAPSSAAALGLYGKMPGVALEDYEHANLIVVWGANPSSTGIHLVPIIRRAREKGAKLVVIDPRRTPLAKQCDLHLAPRPGTDLALALAMTRELFETGRADLRFLDTHCNHAEGLRARASAWTLDRAAAQCDLLAEEIRAFIDLYARSSPAVIRCGWGPERNRNGGSAISAILALPAVAGKFGVRAGGYTLSNTGAYRFRDGAQAQPPRTRRINMNKLGRTLLEAKDPPVRALFVYNSNPLMTLPNQQLVRRGLEREDLFTVVFDQVMTDTARYADLVLPATTFLEHHDLARGYGAMIVHPVRPVIEPVGESRSNVEVFAELVARLGLREPDDDVDPQAICKRMTADREVLASNAPTSETLDSEASDNGISRPPCGDRPIQFVDCFPATSDRKADLLPDLLEAEAPGGLYAYKPHPANSNDAERYPLSLISPATSRTISSTFGQLLKQPARLEMHPLDARDRALDEKTPAVRIYNEQGEVRCGLRLNPDLRRGVVSLPKGLWARSTLSGTTSNTLVPDTLADLGGGACFNDARVEVALSGRS